MNERHTARKPPDSWLKAASLAVNLEHSRLNWGEWRLKQFDSQLNAKAGRLKQIDSALNQVD